MSKIRYCKIVKIWSLNDGFASTMWDVYVKKWFVWVKVKSFINPTVALNYASRTILSARARNK